MVGRRTPEELADLLTVVGLTNQVANIIMQLALPGVGHGVNESRVVSGSPRSRPVKRARTTGQYLALAVMGSVDDRDAYRRELALVHAAVHSTPESPVRYSGNAQRLQKWVAACLFRYYLDQYTLLYGPLDTATLDRLTVAAAPLATGVNVRHSDWPQTWAQFTQYWEQQLDELSVAPEVREDLISLANLRFLEEAWGVPARIVTRPLGGLFSFGTRGSLPPRFRELMGWSWSGADQRRYELLLKALRVIDVVNPFALKCFYRAYLMDLRLRRRLNTVPDTPILGRLKVLDQPLEQTSAV
ncbi:oxygenase MpaB family protein [Mycolicibacterium smegmatis]|uniref:oxygenase MpaB family protein n=1 Tax=Mycolicibacterium smegmatis TaxID=1772 RepID=UPI0013031BB8|nr:oxygenase MpaB family protein [Mycolicibacterium smegmatis]